MILSFYPKKPYEHTKNDVTILFYIMDTKTKEKSKTVDFHFGYCRFCFKCVLPMDYRVIMEKNNNILKKPTGTTNGCRAGARAYAGIALLIH